MTQTSFPKDVISCIEGKCIALPGDDIDTDRIIPARFLKCVNFKDLGKQVFADDRSELKGTHPFDLKINNNASILVVNENFGCGSSREHAPQALMRWGIRAIVGQSFAEIFYGNCLSLGIPCATSSPNEINSLQKSINKKNQQNWKLDLRSQIINSSIGAWKLYIEDGPLEMLLTGKWDATSQLKSNEYELDRVQNSLPYLNKFHIN